MSRQPITKINDSIHKDAIKNLAPGMISNNLLDIILSFVENSAQAQDDACTTDPSIDINIDGNYVEIVDNGPGIINLDLITSFGNKGSGMNGVGCKCAIASYTVKNVDISTATSEKIFVFNELKISDTFEEGKNTWKKSTSFTDRNETSNTGSRVFVRFTKGSEIDPNELIKTLSRKMKGYMDNSLGSFINPISIRVNGKSVKQWTYRGQTEPRSKVSYWVENGNTFYLLSPFSKKKKKIKCPEGCTFYIDTWIMPHTKKKSKTNENLRFYAGGTEVARGDRFDICFKTDARGGKNAQLGIGLYLIRSRDGVVTNNRTVFDNREGKNEDIQAFVRSISLFLYEEALENNSRRECTRLASSSSAKEICKPAHGKATREKMYSISVKEQARRTLWDITGKKAKTVVTLLCDTLFELNSWRNLYSNMQIISIEDKADIYRSQMKTFHNPYDPKLFLHHIKMEDYVSNVLPTITFPDIMYLDLYANVSDSWVKMVESIFSCYIKPNTAIGFTLLAGREGNINSINRYLTIDKEEFMSDRNKYIPQLVKRIAERRGKKITFCGKKDNTYKNGSGNGLSSMMFMPFKVVN